MGRICALLLLPLLACEPAPAERPAGRFDAHDDCTKAMADFRKAGGSGDAHDAQFAVRAIAERPTCFANERVPTPQLRSVVEASARKTVRDLLAERDGRSAASTDGQEACERHTALASDPKLGIGTDGVRDLVDVLCAYADASAGTQSGFLSALTQIEGVRDETLRTETRKDLVLHAYVRRYGLGGPGDDMVALRESYPLSDVTDATAFALERLIPRLYQSPIPVLFFDEQARDERLRRDIVFRHFTSEAVRSKSWATVASMAESYVKTGHDPKLVYRAAFDAVMAGNEDFVTARKLASYLGPAEKRAAVAARIAQLDAAADFDVLVGPDGRESYLYRMRDDPAPE